MVKSNRLVVLETSLEKKKAKLEQLFDTHFASVKEANGQPLNDKRNGQATLNKWERQNNAIRAQKESIAVTEAAIEKEIGKIVDSEAAQGGFPPIITAMIEEGVLTQWRKHPTTLFIKGVDKARLVYDAKQGLVLHKYTSALHGNEDQQKIFMAAWSRLKTEINDKKKVA